MSNVDPEVAVRNYLLFLENPAQLVDAAQISKLEQARASATDPIERLKASAMLTRAKTPGRRKLRTSVCSARPNMGRRERYPRIHVEGVRRA